MKSGDSTNMRFSFAFFRLNERNRDFSPTICKGVNFARMMGKRLAGFSDWVGKNKLRQFGTLLVLWIIFDQVFGYVFHAILGWSRQSWAHSLFSGAWMALWFTVLPIGGRQRRIDS